MDSGEVTVGDVAAAPRDRDRQVVERQVAASVPQPNPHRDQSLA
jgi:hypothetical protein